MSGYRPAGESSDEDDYDGFSFGDDFEDKPRNRNEFRFTIDTAEQQRFNQDAQVIEMISSGTLEELVAAHRSPHSFNISGTLCNDWTPLLHAAFKCRLDMTRWLLANEADVNYRVNGITPLMAAVMTPDRDDRIVLDIVQLLLNNGAILNTGDRSGRTAFMSMVENGYEQAVQHALGMVAIEACDNDGNTALYYAIASKRYDMIKLFLTNGAHTEIENNYGLSPKQWALETGFDRMNDFFPEQFEYVVPHEFLSMFRPEELAPTVFSNPNVPPFFYDLRRMLVQMKSQSLEPLFVDAKMSLMEFLAVTDEKLLEIGVTFPYQRNRIRYSLMKFHRKEFSPHTFRPFTEKDSMGDLFSTISGDLKQLLVANASIKVVLRNNFKPERPNHLADILTVLQDINMKLKRIRALVEKDHRLSGRPAEYVGPQEPVKHRSIFPWFTMSFGAAAFLVGGGLVTMKYMV